MSAGIRRVRILVRTRTCSPKRVSIGGYEQPIAGSRVGTVEAARCELDDGKGAEGDLQAPGPELPSCSKNDAFAINERDINRELHEKRVDTAARRQNQGVVVGEVRASEKTPIASGGVERRFDGPGDDASMARVA